MSVVDLKSISGITSITTPASDNQLTLHTNNTTERLRCDADGVKTLNGRFYSAGTFAYIESSSTSNSTLTLRKSASGADSIDYLQLRDNSNAIKFTINGDGTLKILDSIVHEGDTDTKIRFPAANNISFETTGSEALRIDSNQRVMIGSTASGGWKFRVQVPANASYQSAVNFTNNVNADLQFEIKNSESRLGSSTATPLVFKTGNAEKLRIASDGDLTLTGSDNVEIKMKCGTSSGNNILAFLNSGGTTRGNITYDSDHNFLLFNVNQGERLRITSGGCVYASNFGIGTDSNWKIRANTSNTDLAFEYSTSSTLSDNNIKAYFQGSSTDARLIFRKAEAGSCGLEFRNGTTQKAYQMLDSEENMVYLTQSGVHHRFYTNGANERFRIQSDGLVVINGAVTQGGSSTPASTNGSIGNRYGIISSANNVIIGETSQTGAHYGLHLESRATGRSGGARFAQIGLVNDHVVSGGGSITLQTAASGSDVTERLRITGGGDVRLPDNGQLRFGAGPDLSLYHDHANQVNIITANTNLPIKIQGNVHFYNYAASGGFHAKLDGDGLALQNATRPTLPTTGVQPMIHGYATHFYREIHRTISDYRGLCDGTYSGYLLLVQAYGGSGTTAGKKFYGTIMADRGGTGSGNSSNVAHIHATTAYNTDRFNVTKERNTQYFTHAAKVTYSGTDYLALKFGATGGGPDHGIHIDGTYRNVDANFCKLVRTNEVTVVDDNYGSMNNMPAADALLCGFSQRDMTGSSYDNGTMAGGNTIFEHGDCYNASTGVFTAKFNGVYQFGCGVLVQTGSGRLEGCILINDGTSDTRLCSFNGTGTTYDGPVAVGLTIMRAGWTAKVSRQSGNAYDPGHDNSYFWGYMVQAMNKANVPSTFP